MLEPETKTTVVDIPTLPFSYPFNSFQQWEIAFIYAFAVTFNPHQDVAPSFYTLPSFTPNELEIEIQKEESSLVHQILCASIANVLNRKAAIETFKIALQQLVTDKLKTFDIDLESNPLSKGTFRSLSVDVKLYILHSLVEWQLQDCLAVKAIIEHYNSTTPKNEINPIKAIPIGVDSKKRNYWQFGECCWVWREKPHVKATYEWETVCKNKTDLEQLVNTLSEGNKSEKSLAKTITDEIYELAEKEERRKLRKERAEMRKLFPVEVTPIQLRSRGTRTTRVRYNYDDISDIEENASDDDFEQEKEEEEPTRRSSRRAAAAAVPTERPTRWSSRLNGNTPVDSENSSIQLEDDTMTIDVELNDAVEGSLFNQKNEIEPTATTDTLEMDLVQSQDPMDIVQSQELMDIVQSQTPIDNDTPALIDYKQSDTNLVLKTIE